MAAVLSLGSLKSTGTSTLVLTLASVAAAAGASVTLVDAARDADLVRWAEMPGRPEGVAVARVEDAEGLEKKVRAARRRSDVVIIDAGTAPEMFRAGARAADRALIPLRLSPLSAYGAVLTDALLAADPEKGRKHRDRAFLATCLTLIPSRIARAVEHEVERCRTPRLAVGLVLRTAYEAPFQHGGTVFTLADAQTPGLERARIEAAALAKEAGVIADLSGSLHLPRAA